MLSIETKINGKLTGRVYVTNLHPMGDGKYFYHVEYIQFDRKQKKINFEVIHDRENGMEGLSLLVYQKINEMLK